MARARITSKGQITVPKEVRDRLGVKQGDELDFVFDGDRLEVRPLPRRSLLDFRGLFRREGTSSPGWAEERRIAWEAQTRRLRGAGQDSDE